jgi:hypothetical protein
MTMKKDTGYRVDDIQATRHRHKTIWTSSRRRRSHRSPSFTSGVRALRPSYWHYLVFSSVFTTVDMSLFAIPIYPSLCALEAYDHLIVVRASCAPTHWHHRPFATISFEHILTLPSSLLDSSTPSMGRCHVNNVYSLPLILCLMPPPPPPPPSVTKWVTDHRSTSRLSPDPHHVPPLP